MREDLTGQKFSMLTVESFSGFSIVGRDKRKTPQWNCRCDCGNRTVASAGNLRSGHSQSCGCLRVSSMITHGLSYISEYRVWIGIKSRCYNRNKKGYKNYGGRGIKMCDRWLNSFEVFIQDVGVRPRGTTLGRIDNNGNYEPKNCRWETNSQQAFNKRSNRILEFKGIALPMSLWADRIGVNRKTISNRLSCYGWSVERALTTPVV